MMKIFFVAILIALMNSTCSAEIVHAVGHGNTERNAIRNALRTAVEQKFGAAIRSKTRVKNSVTVADEIAVDSAGLVSRWEIISSRVVNGLFVVEIAADIDDKKISARLSPAEKKSLVDFNADSPRVAVVAKDSTGRRFAEVENEIISALQRQGFTRTVESRADYLVVADVKFLPDNEVSVSSRMIAGGEIIFAGTATGGGMFMSVVDALKIAGQRAAYELSNAALKSAAKIERHVTLLITPATFDRLGGTLTAVSEKILKLDGVNDVFARKIFGGIELDVDFDGTAADFAKLLESSAIKILELSNNRIKI